MKPLSDSKLYQRTLIVLACAGAVFSLIAPGWISALIFGGLIVYVWTFPPMIPTSLPAPPAQPTAVLSKREQRRQAKQQKKKAFANGSLPREIEWKGMIFRSKSEIKIAKTLDHRGIFFIPPVHVRMNAAKATRQSRELDFVICHQGKWGVLEVDGPYHNAQNDAERDRLLRTHGIANIQRFNSKRCYSSPNTVIDEFLRRLT
jgi:Protein of unknown function (DUF559)